MGIFGLDEQHRVLDQDGSDDVARGDVVGVAGAGCGLDGCSQISPERVALTGGEDGTMSGGPLTKPERHHLVPVLPLAARRG